MRLGVALESCPGGDSRETTVARAVRAASGERSGKPHSLHVVQIEHGVLEIGHFEQALLRARIVLHVAVIVEVIAREIGEQSGPESDAVNAPLLQADRSDFDRHTLRPCGKQSGE